MDRVNERDIKETIDEIKDIAPKMVLTDYTKLKRNIQELKRDEMRKMDASSVIGVENFIKDEKLEKFFNEDIARKTLYLSGRSGIGKTEYVKTKMVEKAGAEAVIRVTDKEGLKVLDGTEKAIIMDDINLDNLSAEELLGLFDVCNNHDQRILYGTALLRKGVYRAVISNKTIHEAIRNRNFPQAQIEAILRRIFEVDLKGKVLKLTLELREEK